MLWWSTVRHNSRIGFTLTEIMVATAVSAYMISMAFAALNFTNKAIRRGEDLGARNQCLQSTLLWSLSSRTNTNLAIANGGRCTSTLVANSIYGNMAFVLSDSVTITAYSDPSVTLSNSREWTTRIPLRALNPASPSTITNQSRINNRTSTTLTLMTPLSPAPSANWLIGRSEAFFAPAMKNENL